MSRINDPENFAGRVNLAALVISQGRSTSRSFDNCFENSDGDAVAVSLYRRAQKAPDGALARNLWRYLSQDSVTACAAENAHRTNMAAWARQLRAESKQAWENTLAEIDRQAAKEAYRTELTPAGSQLVIPGCERDAAPSVRQLDLF